MRTEQLVVHPGVAHWRESLSQISTIYTDAKHAADVEEKVGCGHCNFSCIFVSKHRSMQMLNPHCIGHKGQPTWHKQRRS